MRGSAPAGTQYFDSQRVRTYWEAVYRTALRPGPRDELTDDMLRPVCDARASGFLNRLMNWTQREAVAWALRRAPIEWQASRVLDVGCGTGRWSRLLHERGAAVVGVDLTAQAVEAAAALVPEGEFHRLDLLAMEFPAGEFDLALSVTVLQHLPYPEQEEVMRRLRRFLKPGGYLVILEHVRDRGAHMFARDFADWVRLAARSGLAPRAVRGYQFFPLLRLEKALRRRVPAPLGSGGSVAAAVRPPIHSAGGAPNFAKAMYRGAVLAGLVAGSFPAEAAARTILPKSFATHGAFVFAAV